MPRPDPSGILCDMQLLVRRLDCIRLDDKTDGPSKARYQLGWKWGLKALHGALRVT